MDVKPGSRSGIIFIMKMNETGLEGGNMITKLKSALPFLVCVAVVAQLAGCAYDRHGRRLDNERQGQHDRDQGQINLNINLH